MCGTIQYLLSSTTIFCTKKLNLYDVNKSFEPLRRIVETIMKKEIVMKKGILSIISCFVLIAFATSAQAHSFWINLFESNVHKPPHAMVSLGWGHNLPLDDTLTAPNGSIVIERFELHDPSLKKNDLIKPASKKSEPSLTTGNFDLIAADIAAQKIALKEDSEPGVYQISATSKPTFYTQYIDKKGKQRLKPRPMDEIKDIEKTLFSFKYQCFAKSYLTVGPWKNPKPLGHGLEIIPRTDLTNVRVGDLVEVDVLFYGQPLSYNAENAPYILANSSSFGQNDRFSLFSHLFDGKAQFRVQSSGQWVINTHHKGDVTEDGELKDLYGKTKIVYHAATLTFNVK